MRKFSSLLVLAGLVGGLGVAGLVMPAFGQGQTQTVTGTVIDLYCYTQNKEDVGMDHSIGRECAWACVRYSGTPVGILTSEGLAYELAGGLVANDNEKIAPYVTQKVSVTGPVTLRDGMPTITADDVTVVQ